MFIAPLPITVICELFGVPEPDRLQLLGWAERFMAASAPPEQVASTHREVAAYQAELIAGKRTHTADDCAGADPRRRRPADGSRTRDQHSDAADRRARDHARPARQRRLTLSRNPGQFDLLRANPDLVDNTVEELLRYDELITSTMPRIAAEDVDLAGHLIKAGDAVVGVPNIANRDLAMSSTQTDSTSADPRLTSTSVSSTTALLHRRLPGQNRTATGPGHTGNPAAGSGCRRP
jgi:cytochrome P450